MFDIKNHKIKVIFNSGAVQVFKCDECTIKKNSNGMLSYFSLQNSEPKFMYIDISKIDSVIKIY